MVTGLWELLLWVEWSQAQGKAALCKLRHWTIIVHHRHIWHPQVPWLSLGYSWHMPAFPRQPPESGVLVFFPWSICSCCYLPPASFSFKAKVHFSLVLVSRGLKQRQNRRYMICMHTDIVKIHIYICIYVCVYGYIFNYSDKSVFGFSLVGDGGRRTARHSQRLSVWKKISFLHCGCARLQSLSRKAVRVFSYSSG